RITGSNVPTILNKPAKLLVKHHHQPRNNPGAMADPPRTKIATAGRTRRLLAWLTSEHRNWASPIRMTQSPLNYAKAIKLTDASKNCEPCILDLPRGVAA